jgi:GNAT superfamily N-acetyltransferase
MPSIILTTVDGMEPQDALAICYRLTKPGSEFNLEVRRILDGNGSSDTPIALWHEDGALLGWACSHVWNNHQTLEMFTGERHRGRGIATALSAFLLGAGVIDGAEELAVFSPVTADIARRLGVVEVSLYERRDGEWSLV